MAAWFSFKVISDCNLLLRVPSGHLPSINRPYPGISLQSLCSSSQPLHVPGDLCPCPGYVELRQRLSVWFSFHSDCHRSAAAFSSSLKCFSFVPNNCPNVGIWPLLQLPHPWVQVQSCLFPLLPLSYWGLHGSVHFFLVIRDSFLFSAGVLWGLLCLKV